MKLSAIIILAVLMASCGGGDRPADAPAPATDQPTATGEHVSQSKNDVLAYKYHPETKILNVRLSGGYYRFKDVPQSAYDAFAAAGGNTRAYLDTIDQKFKAEFIREEPAWKRADQPKDAGL